MELRRYATTALAVTCAVLATALPAGAAALASRPLVPRTTAEAPLARQKSLLLNEIVRTTGEYAVTVDVRTTSSAGDTVDLTIGTVTRHAVTTAANRTARVTARVAVRGSRLAIRATARRTAATISASWRRVGALPGGTTRGASGGSGGSSNNAGGAQPAIVGTGATGSSGNAGATGSSGSTGSTGSTATSGPPGDPTSWHSIFDDEFTTLNTAVWNTSRYEAGGISPGFNSQEEECFDPAQTTVGGGEADLNLIASPESCGGRTQPYAAPILDTDGKWSYTYGYLEAKVWLPSVSGQIADWPAVWAVGSNWPTGGEIDLMEGLDGQACWHFHSPLGGPGGCASANYTVGWHTFGADWEPGSVTWYYDGQAVGTVTSGVTNSPMQLILNIAIEPGDPVLAPATMRVAYVRVWQH